MTDDRDKGLQQLFDVAGQTTYDDSFVEDVMSRINRRRRGAIIGWAIVAVAMVPVAGLFGVLLQDVFQLIAQILPSQLIDSEAEWLTTALAPINSVGALAAFAFLGLRAAYRWIFA